MADPANLLWCAIGRFRQENSGDPNTVLDHGQSRPKELVDAERLAEWVARLEPNASEALTLASYCQHLKRWEIPRSSYEPGRLGYLKWRRILAKFHARTSTRILGEVGYDEATISAVRQINLKQDLRSNADVQTIEDALCLSFLEHEFEEFRAKHPTERVVDIVRKTWRKMSERARAQAASLPLSARSREVVQEALRAFECEVDNAR